MNYSYLDFKFRIDNVFKIYSQKISIVCMDSEQIRKRIKYSEIANVIENVEKALLNEGLKKRDKIAVIAPHMGAAVILNLALAYLGYINVLIDAALPINEQNRLLALADVDAIFVTKDLYENIANNNKFCVFEVGEDFIYKKIKSVSRKCLKEKGRMSEDVIAILFSSGTTGEMKGIEISYNSIILAQEYMLKYTNLNSEASFLNVLPSNHIAGYSAAMSCLLTGTEMGFVSEVDAYNLSRAFLIYNPTNFIMVPKIYEVIKDKITEGISKKSWLVRFYANTVMKLSGYIRKRTGIKLRLLTKPIWKNALGRNMKICGCGTAPCSEEVIEFYLNLGLDFVNVYGATETGFPICAANCNSKYPSKGVGSVEQFSDINIQIANPDDNGIGEVRVKSPLIMLGYYKDLRMTEEAFDEYGYFKTGDYGYIDKFRNLHITGRMKENILLKNGKKVSPIDVDNFISKYCKNVKVASCGVDCGNGYDEIHLFIETKDKTKEEINIVENSIKGISESIYKISKIHFIDVIPTTSVGKVKRFLLKRYAKINHDSQIKGVEENVGDLRENGILAIVSRISKAQINDINLKLKKDIGMDSLSIFELCVAIEGQYGVSIEQHIHDEITILDIVELIEKNKCEKSEKRNDINDYPINRTERDYRNLKLFTKLSHFLWNFEVQGVENINIGEKYIFCPNHESHFDGMWIVGHLDEKIIRTICSIAADYLFNKKIFRRGLISMGAIPVHRSGNTTMAMKRAYECISKEGYSLLIHPEGTRTRNGELGEFKAGAAKLAIETGTKIVPVCINGAYEVFPPHRKLPRLFDWRHMGKYKLQIQYGIPIEPDNMTEKEITEEIRRQIVELKDKLRNRK